MMNQLAAHFRRRSFGVAITFAVACAGAPLVAQGIQTIDPDSAIDGDLAQPGSTTATAPEPVAPASPPASYDDDLATDGGAAPYTAAAPAAGEKKESEKK